MPKLIDKLVEVRDRFDWLNSKAAFTSRSAEEKQAIYTAVALAEMLGDVFYEDE